MDAEKQGGRRSREAAAKSARTGRIAVGPPVFDTTLLHAGKAALVSPGKETQDDTFCLPFFYNSEAAAGGKSEI